MDFTRRLEIREGEGAALLLVGELDVATSADLDTRMRAASSTSTVVLDLAGVTFIDSSALRVLIEHHQRFEGAGGRLELTNVSDPASRLLEIAGLDGVLNLG